MATQATDIERLHSPNSGPAHPREAERDGAEQLIRRYLLSRSTRLLSASREAYHRDLLQVAAEREGAPLLEATFEDVASWLYSRLRDPKDPTDERPWGRRTGLRKLAALRGFYDWAIKAQLVAANPTVGVEIARFEKPAPVRLPQEDVERLFEFLADQVQNGPERLRASYLLDAAVFRLCYNLALRISEASGLRLSRMREAEGERIVLVAKKGDKIKPYPIAGVVAAALDEWLEVRRTIQPEAKHEDFVFVHPDTGRRISRRRSWDRLRKIGRRAGLSEQTIQKLSAHKLRHARAYYLLKSGKDLATVQAILDHEDIATTSIYIQDDEAARIRALRESSM
jgi:site-specific recombinase XerD